MKRKCGAYFGSEQNQADYDEQLAVQSAGHDESGGSAKGGEQNELGVLGCWLEQAGACWRSFEQIDRD